MNLPDTQSEGKMELLSATSELMPQGVPNYIEVIKYPTITKLCQEHGKKSLRMAISLLVRDLCNSLNVVRNMNEDQIIEAAAMLLDECGDFRLEDYVMMFSLAKRGQLVNIMDRIDIDTIGKMLDVYWQKRYQEGQRAQEQQIRGYENNLRKIEAEARAERSRVPATEKEKILKEKEDAQQDEFFKKLKEIAKGMDAGTSEEKMKQYQKRDDMVKKHQEMLKKQVELRMAQTLKEIANIDEGEFLPDGVINDMVFLLTAHNLEWKNLVCKKMKVTMEKLESIINFKNTNGDLRISFIREGKEVLGL